MSRFAILSSPATRAPCAGGGAAKDVDEKAFGPDMLRIDPDTFGKREALPGSGGKKSSGKRLPLLPPGEKLGADTC